MDCYLYMNNKRIIRDLIMCGIMAVVGAVVYAFYKIGALIFQ